MVEHLPDVGDVRGGMQDVAHAGPHGRQAELRAGLTDQDDTDNRALRVEAGRQFQRFFRLGPRVEHDDLGRCHLVEVGEDVSGIGRKRPSGQGQECAIGGLVHPFLKLGRSRRQYDAAHL
jgi:hypothetical protein